VTASLGAPDILVVEDEPALAALVADYLRAAGWLPRVLHDGAAALADIRRAPPDLLVLDLMLPGLDGLSLCRAVRGFSDLPVVMVTARVDEVDRLMGLDIGADDYMCKPFSPRELVARVRALLRRARPAAAATRPIEVDEHARLVRVHGRALALTPTEFVLFSTMARRTGTAWSRAALLDRLRAEAPDVSERAIDSHVKNLRRKLAEALPGVEVLHSVYGLGYRVSLPDVDG
jgi:two-component system, OmpR family, response regulator BaeR